MKPSPRAPRPGSTFIWPPEVRWPPPANILLNYDSVVPPAVTTSAETPNVLHSADVAPIVGGLHVVITSDRDMNPSSANAEDEP